MKLKGYKPENPNIEIVVIPRGDRPAFVFKAQAILDMGPFDKLCPAPRPPTISYPDGTKKRDIEDPKFRDKFVTYLKQRDHWICINSLRATDELEWEKVNYSEPSTWHHYIDELKEFKLSPSEIELILQAVRDANGLNEDKIEAARKSFLAGQAAELEKQSSPNTVQEIIQSLEPVNDLESDRPE